MQTNQTQKTPGFALVDHVYRLFLADRLVSCYIPCTTQPTLNCNLVDKSCEYSNETKYYRPKDFVEKPAYVYADNPDSGAFLLLSFYFIFFHIVSGNNSYFLDFALFPPFFYFFLTGKILISCELSSCQKKKHQ